MNKIYLWGMMGAGKSTIGSEIAKVLNKNFIDVDVLIEKKEDLSITEIFEQKGEVYFRELERLTLHEIVHDGAEGIYACGGGTPCFYDNDERMLQSGLCIYLKADVDLLIKHLYNDAGKRPLLEGVAAEEMAAYLEKMLDSREEIYEVAHIVLPISGSLEEDTKNLLSAIKDFDS
jgi:shikimate kinase